MTLRSSDLQSDSDLGSIRNSCDVLLSKEQHDQHMRRQLFRIILLFVLLQSIFSKYSGFNIGPVYSTCCGCGCSQKTLSLDQTNWEIGKQNVNVSFEQGGRTWQAFGGGKNGHETFRQARIYNFRDKCVVFARNLKFSNLTQ